MNRSQTLFDAAQVHIPGGVNSPVRAFRSVQGTPVFIARGEGAWLVDEDGRRYVDYVAEFGPAILGHAHPSVVGAVQEAAAKGLGFGAPTALETQLADLVCELMPSIEMVRMVNSGTEATMTAIRLARGFTERDRIIKFEGCYHGHADSLLVKAGSGALTLGVPTSPGVPKDLVRHTITLPYNDPDALTKAFAELSDTVAAVIVEPVAGNMSCVPPIPGFLEAARSLCDKHGTVLIFDEVMTGFRVALGGAQALYGVRPDLTTLGKIIGGGMPVGAFGGRADIMAHIAPLGPVYQAGTLSGNPLSMAAGLATLQALRHPGFHDELGARTQTLLAGLRERAQAAGIAFTTNQVGAMFGLFFSTEKVIDSFAKVSAGDVQQFNTFFHVMLDNGVYLAPSSFEAGFVSACHGDAEFEHTWRAAEKAFAGL